MKFSSLIFRALFMLVVCVGVSGCQLFRGEDTESTPTLDVTQAYQTVNAKLTQAVAETPSRTIQPTASATSVTQGTPTGLTPSATATNTGQPVATEGNCENRAAPGVPIDVTIPDDTQMTSGQEFTKTWRLQNSGTCTWTREYAVAHFSGDPMGAPTSVRLSQEVPPGRTIDISVDMVAPANGGSFQGNWKLRSAAGTWFGIGPNYDSAFWVRIIVTALPTATPSAIQGTPAATPTAPVLVSGTVDLLPGDTLDLDNAQVNAGSGADLNYLQVADGLHQLQAVGSARLGVFGAVQPGFAECQSASPSATFVNVEALPPGTYLCYRSGLGWPGRAMVSDFDAGDAALRLEIITWSLP